MKNLLKSNQMCFLALVMTLLFTFNSCSTEEVITPSEELTISNDDNSSKKKMYSANGQGGLSFEVGAFNGHQSFSFHASVDVEGNVSGSWQSNYNDLNDAYDINTHGTIECLIIVDNRAIMAGQITHLNAGEYWDDITAVGNYTYFEVVDNGQGSRSMPDQFSDIYVGLADLLCDDFSVALSDITNGNIQVNN